MFDDDFRIETTHVDGQTVLVVAGDVDMATAPTLQDAIIDVLRSAGRVVLDFTGVTFMDSSGLKALVGSFKAAPTPDAMRIQNVPEQIRRLLAITDLDRFFAVDYGPTDTSSQPRP